MPRGKRDYVVKSRKDRKEIRAEGAGNPLFGRIICITRYQSNWGHPLKGPIMGDHSIPLAVGLRGMYIIRSKS